MPNQTPNLKIKMLRFLVVAFICTVGLHAHAQSIPAPSDKNLQSADEYETLGNQLYEQKKYDLALPYFTKAFEIEPTHNGAAYSVACLYALMGKKELAFLWLEKAKNAFFLDAKHTETDEDLLSLHDDPRWPKILNAMAKGEARKGALWNSKVWATPYKDQLSEDEKVAGLSKYWSEVKYNFVYTDKLMDLDWDAVYLRYLPKVRAAKNTYEYYKLLMEMNALLGDGHTNVYAPKEIYNTYYASTPIRTKLIEDSVIVTDIVDAKLQEKGLVRGVEILSINNTPVKVYESEHDLPYTVAASPQDLNVRLYNYQFLSGKIDESVKLGLMDEKGRRFDVDLSRDSDANISKAFKGSPSSSIFKVIGDGIVLVSLNSFGSDRVAELYLRDFPEISKAKAIIFDVRKNGGGSGSVGFKILSTLVDKPFLYAQSHTRDYKPYSRAQGQVVRKFTFPQGSVSPDLKNQFNGEVVVLTSAMSFSAAEDFVVAFKQMKRGLVIGEATAGSTGQPLGFSLPGGGSARVCTKEDTFADGTKFIGIGVKPDLEAHQTVADFRANKDTVLAFALDTLKKKLSAN